VRIVVEQRHIDAGVMCTESACPVALAVTEALAGEPFERVCAGGATVVIAYEDGREKVFTLPWQVDEIINEYDDTGVMYPFGFEL
jgi:hypothetical protein